MLVLHLRSPLASLPGFDMRTGTVTPRSPSGFRPAGGLGVSREPSGAVVRAPPRCRNGAVSGWGRRPGLVLRVRHGPVAQGIEQRFPKPCVGGSNPLGATRIVAGQRFVGRLSRGAGLVA